MSQLNVTTLISARIGITGSVIGRGDETNTSRLHIHRNITGVRIAGTSTTVTQLGVGVRILTSEKFKISRFHGYGNVTAVSDVIGDRRPHTQCVFGSI